MTTHKNAKFHITIATLLLFSMGILFSGNTFSDSGKNMPAYAKVDIALPAVHFIGEEYGGGIVFYVYDDGQHGLIAARADQNGGNPVRWYGGTNTNTRARADWVGAGKANTAIIIANQGSVDGARFAATLCNEYSAIDANGVRYGDWYLPSYSELFLLRLQKNVVGGLANKVYWSSTEFDRNKAKIQRFSGAQNFPEFKSLLLNVRAIRAF